MENEKEIELSSEVVRDYINQIPHTLVRWGSTVIAMIMLMGITLTWIIEYPTIVRCEFKLTTQVAPKPVLARAEARLQKLLVANHQHVTLGQALAFIENTASHEEVLQLEILLNTIDTLFSKGDLSAIDIIKHTSFAHLGEIQIEYQSFHQQLSQLNSLLGRKYYIQKKNLLQNDIKGLTIMNQHLDSQHSLYARDETLAENEFLMNQKLFNEKVISKLDIDREESKFLARRIPLKNIETSLLNNKAQIRAKQNEIIDLDRQVNEQSDHFLQSLNTLRSTISTWKKRYVLVSPTEGKLLFSVNIQEKENIKLNTELFNVFENNSNYIGVLTIAQENVGRIKLGQRVLIKFHSYPFEEYCLVEGKISSSPELSSQDEKFFSALVELPNGLTTSHGKSLTYNFGLTASAEIVTEDLRLFQRIFYSIRGIFR